MCPKIRRAEYGLLMSQGMNLPRTGTPNNKMLGRGQLGLGTDMTFRNMSSQEEAVARIISPMSNLDQVVSNLFLYSELSYEDSAGGRKKSGVF